MSATERRVIRELRRAGFTVLTRRQWGSKHLGVYQQRRVTRRFVGKAHGFFAHITVTNDTGNARADAQTVEQIGMSRFGTGWSYNWGLHRSTKTILVGQPHDAAGAHTLNDKNVPGFPENLNYWGHAIAFIGVPGDPFTDWCEDAAAAIIAAEKKHGAAERGADIYPHSKFAAKDCPCDPYRNALGRIMRKSKTGLHKPTEPTTPTVPDVEDDMALDDSLNVHDPKGREATRGITVREALTAQTLHILHGRRAARKYLRSVDKRKG